MSLLVRRRIPIALVFITALLIMMDYFITLPPLDANGKSWTSPAVKDLQNWGIILTAFALGFGAVNLFILHSRHISRRTPKQWPFSVWLLLMIILFTGIGVYFGATSPEYSWLYNSSYFALSATVYSSLGFYMTSGIYRALRARNIDAAILLITGGVALLKNAPAVAVSAPIVVSVNAWLNAVPTTSAMRGIMISASLGAIALGIRTMTGKETGFLGRLTEVEKGG